MKEILILIIIIVTQFSLTAQNSALEEYFKIQNSKDGIEAMVKFYDLSFAGDEFDVTGKVTIFRNSLDSIYRSSYCIDSDSLLISYDKGDMYVINNTKKEKYFVRAGYCPGCYVQSTRFSHLINYTFIDKVDLLNSVEVNKLHYKIIDTIIDGQNSMALKVYFPDADGFTSQKLIFAVNRETYLPNFKSFEASFQGNRSYRRWNYSDVKFINSPRVECIPNLDKSEFVDIETIANEKVELKIGDQFPYYTGIESVDKEPTSLSEVTSPFIIVDFWFSGCYPCIKSIPHVNSLFDKLNGDLISFTGINPIDKFPKDEARIRKFEQHNPMKYSTILPDDPKVFGHLAYPTFMILDKNRKIVFLNQGLSEDTEKEVLEFFKQQGIYSGN